MATLKEKLNKMCPAVANLPDGLGSYLEDMRTSVLSLYTAVVELMADHATAKTERDELHIWAETLAAKLNLDGGVTDQDYDATIAATTTETLAASAPTAPPASLDV